MTDATRARRLTGPALFRYGFRPFFLGAGVWALIAMTFRLADLWLQGTGFAFEDPNLWHAHAFLFGYAGAVVAGFTLTAVPNWTGRLPVTGPSLAGLFALWAAGRLALFLPWSWGVFAVDALFLPVLAAVLAREISAGKNVRNLPVVGLVALFAAANIAFHLQAQGLLPASGAPVRAAVGLLVLLIGVIGGRIVPSFTNNWFARMKLPRDAKSAPLLDRATHTFSGAAIAAWVIAPDEELAGILFLLAASAHAVRLSGWYGWRTGADPLVAVLHVGYAWIPVGFALLAVSILGDAALYSPAIHALTAGAVGTMTLAVMTRATLGHTGRELRAGPGTLALYAAVTMAAALRVGSGFAPSTVEIMSAAAVFWLAAFVLFAGIYGPMQLKPRLGELR